MIFLNIIEYFIAFFIGGFVVYNFILSLSALMGRKSSVLKTIKNRRFLIIIPAQNEENTISKTLYSLLGMIYPRNLYDPVVLAYNCTDNTTKVAKSMGAKVLIKKGTNSVKKVEALRWAFKEIERWKEHYDAVIVLNPNSLISGNYFEVMNFYLEKGNTVIQSSNLLNPDSKRIWSDTFKLENLLNNFVNPLGRKVLGLPINSQGNGICFSSGILNHHSILNKILDLNKYDDFNSFKESIKINFAPEASTQLQSEKNYPLKMEISHYKFIKKHVLQFLKLFFSTRSYLYLDPLIEFFNPSFINSLCWSLSILFINLLLCMLSGMAYTFVKLWIFIIGLGVINIFIGIFAARADKKIYKSIIYIPIFIVWKFKRYLSFIFNKKKIVA